MTMTRTGGRAKRHPAHLKRSVHRPIALITPVEELTNQTDRTEGHKDRSLGWTTRTPPTAPPDGGDTVDHREPTSDIPDTSGAHPAPMNELAWYPEVLYALSHVTGLSDNQRPGTRTRVTGRRVDVQ